VAFSHKPLGAVAAALVGIALVAAAPFTDRDVLLIDAVRGVVTREAPSVVAVELDGAPVAATLALARAGGARQVLGPSLEPLPAARRAPIARVRASALLDGAARRRCSPGASW
jgi:hypothetical protein